MRTPSRAVVCLAVAVASGLWGLYWLPQRILVAGGLTGGWGTLAQFVIPLLLLVPLAVWRRAKGRPSGAGWWVIGLLFGGGGVCYANSFLLTDVVRALLLFYLTPVWATLLERFVQGKPLAPARFAALALSLAGVWIVFGQDGMLPLPRNAGDWLALISGAMIAAAAARINAVQPDSPLPLLFSCYLYGTAVAFLLGWALADELGPIPAADDLLAMLPFLLVLTFGFLLPTVTLLLWSPIHIGAGAFSILILTELVVGAVSAALLTDEAFGWREATGCALILAAGAIEVLVPGAREADPAQRSS